MLDFKVIISLKYNVEVAMFEMQCKVTCLKCNVKVAKFEMQCKVAMFQIG